MSEPRLTSTRLETNLSRQTLCTDSDNHIHSNQEKVMRKKQTKLNAKLKPTGRTVHGCGTQYSTAQF